MKRLFQSSSGRTAGKKEASGPLTNKTVQVGSHQVLCGALLGSGGYADIYSVVDISSGGRFALKHLRLAGEPETISEVQREAKTMARLKGHPNILRLHAVAFAGPRGGETDGFFLLELCPGSLLDLMARHAYQLDDATVLHVFGCVVAAVAHMHAQQPPLAHRDLKAENVLMRPDGTWVLCDYGSATTRACVYDSPEAMAAEEEVIRRHTTPAYRPPEMWDLYLRQPIDTKVDIWALGVLLYVLCFGRLPFTGDSKLAVINAKYDLPQATRPPQLRALIRQLLEPDPAQRPDVTAVSRQLDEAARAITGRGLPQLRAAASSSNSSASASATAAGNSKPAAPPQLQQQPPPPQQQQADSASGPSQAKVDAASSPASGSFWTTADAAAAPASSQQQQHAAELDWAKFSSGGAAGNAPAAAASSAVARGQAAAARPAPPARPLAGTPAAAAAAHSSSLAARHSANQQHSLNSNGSLTAGANGHGSVSANGALQSFQQQQQQQQEQRAMSSDGQLSRLADITARAAQAAQAAAAARMTTAQQQQQQSPGIAALAANDTASNSRSADSGSFAERVPQPYASVSGSVETIRPSSQGSSGTRGGSGSSSSSAAPMDRPKEAPASSRVGDTSGAAVSGAAPSTATNMVRPSTSQQQQQQQRQQQQQQPRPAPVAVPTAAGAVSGTAAAAAVAAVGGDAGGGGVTAAALAELRGAVFGELDLLRVQVVSLADAEQAFLVRIKQLEEYGQQQHETVGRLQQQVASLQQQVAGLQQQQQQRQPSSQHNPEVDQMGTDGAAAERHGWLRGITRSSRGSESGAAMPTQPSGGTSSNSQRSAAGAGTFWSLQHSEDVI